jgi:hypothetical protein
MIFFQRELTIKQSTRIKCSKPRGQRTPRGARFRTFADRARTKGSAARGAARAAAETTRGATNATTRGVMRAAAANIADERGKRIKQR